MGPASRAALLSTSTSEASAGRSGTAVPCQPKMMAPNLRSSRFDARRPLPPWIARIITSPVVPCCRMREVAGAFTGLNGSDGS